MNFLKAITTEGKTELFNINNILSVQPNTNGTTKILMGAGLSWRVHTNSIEWINCYNEFIAAIDGV